MYEENANLMIQNKQLTQQIENFKEKQKEINDILCFLRKENKKLSSFIRKFNQFEDSQKKFHENAIQNSLKKIENFVKIKEDQVIQEQFCKVNLLGKSLEKNISCLNIETNLNNLTDKNIKEAKKFNQNITNISESLIKIIKIEFISSWGKVKKLENY